MSVESFEYISFVVLIDQKHQGSVRQYQRRQAPFQPQDQRGSTRLYTSVGRPSTVFPFPAADSRLCISLLKELDDHAFVGPALLSSVASKDCLFLQYDHYYRTLGNNVRSHRYVIEITTALLRCLHDFPSGKERLNPGFLASIVPFDSLLYDNYEANLEHILLSLQQSAKDAILQYYVKIIQDSLLRWYQFWLHKKGAINDWFAEWPNGQHPLSTTWPWNIKPALLVLWGVCWMFYDFDKQSSENLGASDITGQESFWTRQAAAQSQPTLQPRESGQIAYLPALLMSIMQKTQ